jgi:predicted AlkP superfamily phosphohydrolase/phosphomutase
VVFARSPAPRVVVLGLDGTPYTLIKQFTEDGVMPNLKKIIDESNFHQMDTTMPEISSVAWSTFMTGKNPGEHGIFGFTDLEAHSYRMRFPTFNDLKALPLWKELEKSGKRTVVINLPSTYPAQPLQGVLVSGFVALRLERASYPESIVPALRKMNYRIDVDTMKAREDKDFLIRELHETLKIRKKAVDYFWQKENWDLFIAVVTGTDRLQHFLMDAFDDSAHPYYQKFLDYYNFVDGEMIGGVAKKLEDGMRFFILSDHGFTKIEKEVYVNRWLVENGYLTFKNDHPESIEEIAKGSRIFAMDPGRIYVNLKGKYPYGEVNGEEECNALCDEITEKLMALQHNGKPVMRKICKREEIYSGSFANLAPDLVAQSNYGFDLKGSTKSKDIFGNSLLTGMHTQDDAFLVLPREQRIEGKPHISQLHGVIVALLR